MKSLLVVGLASMLRGGLSVSGEINVVYVVVPTHLDIGFTAPPDVVARGCKDSIDHAIELCERYPDYFYTIECAWQLREWMKRSSPEEVAKLGELVKAGRVEIGGAFATMHSGMMSGECVNRMFDLGLSLAKKFGGEISTAIQDDVPGYTWAYPQAMRRKGIRFLLTGINTSFGGKPKLGRKDNPFYWEGPDGSRVLTWIADGYADGNEWGIGIWEKEDAIFGRIPERIRTLEEEGYRYDAFLVMASPGDNVDAVTTEKIYRLIGKWNATGKGPILKMATPRQFFECMEQEYADRFPVYRGDWSGHWEPAKLGSPRLIARMRFSQRILPAAEALWSVLALSGTARFPSEDIAAAWDDLLTISEHTAAAGTGWPDLTTKEEVVWENWQHAFRGLSASYRSSMLMQEGMGVLVESVSADGPFIAVFNSLPWKRTDYVEANLPADILKRGLAIRAENDGEEIEWDMLEDLRTVRFLARDVPGLGYRLFNISPGVTRNPPVPTDAFGLETERLRLSLDPQTGYIKSIYDKKLEREWLEEGRFFSALHLLRHFEAMLGRRRLAKAGEPHAEVVRGKTYATLRIRRGGESPLVETSITVRDFGGSPLEVENTLDISRIPGDDRVVGILEFPFNLDAESLKILVDGPNHFRRWPEDFLPGTARVGQVVQSCAFLRDKEAAVSLVPVEAPILSFGRIDLQSLHKPRSARVYSCLFDRDLWGQNRDTGRTRYEEVEPALGTKITFTYYLDFYDVSQEGYCDSVAGLPRRDALEATVPLFARFQLPWGKQRGKLGEAATRTFIETGEPDIELSSATVISWEGRNCWQLRFQESCGFEGRPMRTATVGFPVRSAWLLDAAGKQPNKLAAKGEFLNFPVSAFQTVTLFVETQTELR